jgi:hypothetical protein
MAITQPEDMQSFGFYLPLQKSKQPERKHGADLWTVEGVGATEDLDQQDEELLMDGMDFTPYLKSGVINWNHQDTPGAILGEPLEGKILRKAASKAAFFTKGFLYEHQKMAQDLWAHICGLEKSQLPVSRGIGWSVQGGVVNRQGKRLVKSVVRHMALTHEPVNANTWARTAKTLAKSLGGVGVGEAGYPVIGQSYNTLSPALVQNLDSTITKLLFSPCAKGCCDDTGDFAGGYHGVLEHLTRCQGVPLEDAKRFVLALQKKKGS